MRQRKKYIMKNSKDLCNCPNCKRPIEIIYKGFPTCEKHWNLHCEDKINLNEIYNIKEVEK